MASGGQDTENTSSVTQSDPIEGAVSQIKFTESGIAPSHQTHPDHNVTYTSVANLTLLQPETIERNEPVANFSLPEGEQRETNISRTNLTLQPPENIERNVSVTNLSLQQQVNLAVQQHNLTQLDNVRSIAFNIHTTAPGELTSHSLTM